MRISQFAAAFVLVTVSPVFAADVGSAPAFSPGQKVGFCYYSNVGSTPVTFSSARAYSEPGIAVSEVADDCTSLLANRSCRVAFNITAATAHWCAATVNNKLNLRGRYEVRATSGAILTSETMH